jgi:hypothetical protein
MKGEKQGARTVLRRRSAPTARRKAKRLRKQRKAQRPMEAGREVAKPPIGLELRRRRRCSESEEGLSLHSSVLWWEWEKWWPSGSGASCGARSSATDIINPRFGVACLLCGPVLFFFFFVVFLGFSTFLSMRRLFPILFLYDLFDSPALRIAWEQC